MTLATHETFKTTKTHMTSCKHHPFFIGESPFFIGESPFVKISVFNRNITIFDRNITTFKRRYIDSFIHSWLEFSSNRDVSEKTGGVFFSLRKKAFFPPAKHTKFEEWLLGQCESRCGSQNRPRFVKPGWRFEDD